MVPSHLLHALQSHQLYKNVILLLLFGTFSSSSTSKQSLVQVFHFVNLAVWDFGHTYFYRLNHANVMLLFVLLGFFIFIFCSVLFSPRSPVKWKQSAGKIISSD